MYTLVWTNTFTRTAKRFFRHHLDLKDTFADNLSHWARFYRDYAPWIENVLCAKGISPLDAEHP